LEEKYVREGEMLFVLRGGEAKTEKRHGGAENGRGYESPRDKEERRYCTGVEDRGGQMQQGEPHRGGGGK